MKLSFSDNVWMGVSDSDGLVETLQIDDDRIKFDHNSSNTGLIINLADKDDIPFDVYGPYQGTSEQVNGQVKVTRENWYPDRKEIELSIESQLYTLLVTYCWSFRSAVLEQTWGIVNTAGHELPVRSIELRLPEEYVLNEPGEQKEVRSAGTSYNRRMRRVRLNQKELLFWLYGESEYADNPERSVSTAYRFLVGGNIPPGQRWMAGSSLYVAYGLAETKNWKGPGPYQWFTEKSISTIAQRTSWIEHSSIYETLIGFWPMEGDGRVYSPYPKVQDLIDDLPRIADQGYDTIYLMPHHPFPSYSVADFENPDIQYGDGCGTEGRIKELCEKVHASGMKLILDVLLHGVLDQESLAYQRRRRTDLAKQTELGSRWNVYEKAHEAYWEPLLPKYHPYYIKHPEWFSKDIDGRNQFTYTRSFDLGNTEFQEFFIQAHVNLVEQLGIDGFRFDAPQWNIHRYQWEHNTNLRPSYQSIAASVIISNLYTRCVKLNPEIGFYCETGSPEFMRGSQLCYSYDYYNVLEGLCRNEMTAKEAMFAFNHLDTFRVHGVSSSYFTDSHDSVWDLPIDHKYWIEKYPIGPIRSGMAVTALIKGSIMHFDGGHKQIRDCMRELLSIRNGSDEILYGSMEYLFEQIENERVFAFKRTLNDNQMFVLVSFSPELEIIDLRRLVNIQESHIMHVRNNTGIEAESYTLQPYELLLLSAGPKPEKES